MGDLGQKKLRLIGLALLVCGLSACQPGGAGKGKDATVASGNSAPSPQTKEKNDADGTKGGSAGPDDNGAEVVLPIAVGLLAQLDAQTLQNSARSPENSSKIITMIREGVTKGVLPKLPAGWTADQLIEYIAAQEQGSVKQTAGDRLSDAVAVGFADKIFSVVGVFGEKGFFHQQEVDARIDRSRQFQIVANGVATAENQKYEEVEVYHLKDKSVYHFGVDMFTVGPQPTSRFLLTHLEFRRHPDDANQLLLKIDTYFRHDFQFYTLKFPQWFHITGTYDSVKGAVEYGIQNADPAAIKVVDKTVAFPRLETEYSKAIPEQFR